MSTYNVRCGGCGKTMSRDDWNVHACPATPKPLPGEPWPEYKARAEAFQAEYLAVAAPKKAARKSKTA